MAGQYIIQEEEMGENDGEEITEPLEVSMERAGHRTLMWIELRTVAGIGMICQRRV